MYKCSPPNKGHMAWQALDSSPPKQFLESLISSRDPMLLEPFWHMKPFVQGWPHISLDREMLQEREDNLHQLIV